MLSNHEHDFPHLHRLQISLQFLGSRKILIEAQKLRPARWVLAPMRSAASWEQMVRRKTTVPNCLNPNMPNGRYMYCKPHYMPKKKNSSIGHLRCDKIKLIRHKQSPDVLKLLDHVLLVSINTSGKTVEKQHHSSFKLIIQMFNSSTCQLHALSVICFHFQDPLQPTLFMGKMGVRPYAV